MNNKVPIRIKSAAFLRKLYEQQENPKPQPQPNSSRLIPNLPVSESIFVPKDHHKHRRSSTAKTISPSKLTLSRSTPSSSSNIWKKVYSTRSEVRLKGLDLSRMQEEPIMLNLMQKVERIKSKHSQKEKAYEKECTIAQKIITQRCWSLKKQGNKGDLQRKILDLIVPFQQATKLAEQRYLARLSRLSKY